MRLERKGCFLVFVSFVVIFLLGVSPCFSKESNQGYWPTEDWRTSTPEAQGMDAQKLESMDKHILENYPDVRSLIIVRNGYIVFEKYYKEDKNYEQTMWSATKSIISALIGIAIDKGYIEGIDQKMCTFFPEFAKSITDPRRKQITIRDLLTMSAGFGPAMEAGTTESCFEQAIIHDPGTHPAYNSCETQLLSGIITKTTKMNSFQFSSKFLFEPLGIKDFFWGIPSAEYTSGGYGLNMRSRDMAKIGYLYLKNGVWEGKQIVPKQWVKESTQKQVIIPIGQMELPYGYQWWITSPGGYPGFCAVGIGGQYIHVVPDLNIVMVATSDTMLMHPAHQGLMASYIVPAVLK